MFQEDDRTQFVFERLLTVLMLMLTDWRECEQSVSVKEVAQRGAGFRSFRCRPGLGKTTIAAPKLKIVSSGGTSEMPSAEIELMLGERVRLPVCVN